MSNTTTMLVYFDAEGTPIHFGEWVYFYDTNSDGTKTVLNPIPADVTFSEVEVSVGGDGVKFFTNP